MPSSLPNKLTLTTLCVALLAHATIFQSSFVSGQERTSLGRPDEEPVSSVSSKTIQDAPIQDVKSTDEAGHCVLLRNDNVLFGIARQLGELVVIHTDHGGEIQLERQEVLCWANSLRDLYHYRVDQRQPGDLSAMLRDAEWCLRFELFDLASRDIRKVLSIDPRNARATRLENRVRREFANANSARGRSDARQRTWSTKDANPRMAAREPQSLPDRELRAGDVSQKVTGRRNVVQVVGYQNDLENQQGSELSDAIDPATLQVFASKIQPMLVNRCGSCHDASVQDARSWKLVTPKVGSRASSRMTRDNLWLALSYIDSKSPEQSLLFTKATTAHGGEEAPLGVRSAKAAEALRSWLWMASALMAQHSGKNSLPAVTTNQIFNSPASQPMNSQITSTAEVVHLDEANGKALRLKAGQPIAPSRLPLVTNPFDPDLFNRRLDVNSSENRE